MSKPKTEEEKQLSAHKALYRKLSDLVGRTLDEKYLDLKYYNLFKLWSANGFRANEASYLMSVAPIEIVGVAKDVLHTIKTPCRLSVDHAWLDGFFISGDSQTIWSPHHKSLFFSDRRTGMTQSRTVPAESTVAIKLWNIPDTVSYDIRKWSKNPEEWTWRWLAYETSDNTWDPTLAEKDPERVLHQGPGPHKNIAGLEDYAASIGLESFVHRVRKANISPSITQRQKDAIEVKNDDNESAEMLNKLRLELAKEDEDGFDIFIKPPLNLNPIEMPEDDVLDEDEPSDDDDADDEYDYSEEDTNID